MDRTEFLLTGLDKRSMTGLELGPFFTPIAPKREGWRTVVVDFTDGPALRATATTHPSDYIRERVGLIEDVDVVWRGEPIAEITLPLHPEGYDFIIASHVVEHVPDLVGFFKEAARLLKPSGIVALALPDMRRCFDVFKSVSNTADALDAHRERHSKHSPKTMFEAWAYAAHIGADSAWLNSTRFEPHFASPLGDAWRQYTAYVEKLEAGEQPYVDAHAWRMTPASFEMMMLELGVLGMIDFHIAAMQETIGADFMVRLERGFEPPHAGVEAARNDLALRRSRELAEPFLLAQAS